MQINGKTLSKINTQTVILQRGGEDIPLLLSALPPGHDDLMSELGLSTRPTPPERAATHPNGKIKKDAKGMAIFEPDYNDPVYVKEVADYINRRSAVTLATGLRNSDVKFSVERPTGTDREEWLKYADALAQEVFDPDTGFNEAEAVALIDHINKLACSLKVEEAMNGFLDHQ